MGIIDDIFGKKRQSTKQSVYYNKPGSVRKDSTPLKALSPVGNTSIKSPALLRGVADAQGLYSAGALFMYFM